MFISPVRRLAEFPEQLIKESKSKWDSMIDDETAAMTMIALLYNRVEKVKINISLTSEPNKCALNLDPTCYSLHLFQNIENNPWDDINGFKEVKKLEQHEKFLTKMTGRPVHIRTMPNENTACIYIDDTLNIKKLHIILSMLTAYFPSINAKKKLTQDEINLMETLTKRDANDYIEKMRVITSSESFKKFSLSYSLDGFEKKLFKKKVDAAKYELLEIEKQMEQAMNMYRDYAKRRMTAAAIVTGFEYMTAQTEERTDLQEYIAKSKNICCFNVGDDSFSFDLKTYLTPYNFDNWDDMRRNGSVFNRSLGGAVKNAEDAKLLLNAILSEDHTLKVKMCAFIIMKFFANSCTSQRNHDFCEDDPDFANYIPNPHLDTHNCFGQNMNDIVVNMQNGDVIGAIEACLNVARRVNVNESASFTPFIEKLYRSTGKCIVNEDGQEMTVKEALEYLRSKQ